MKTCIFILLFCAIAIVHSTKPPKWDPNYIVRGTLYIPYAELAEPFYGWYDKNTKRSRIDYYGGMVKTYQLSNEGSYGTSLKMAPIAMDSYTSTDVCLQVNGTSEDRVEIQSILPDTKDFVLQASEIFNGVKCDKFAMEQVVGQKRNVYTLWVRYKPSPKYPSSRQPIPVRYEMKGYNTLLGSHYDHYYLDYDFYSHEDIPNEVFEISEEITCLPFPGPGNGHYATFNPMQEFIHPTSTDHVEHEFFRFKNKHGKKYGNDMEHDNRRDIFRQNLRYIHSMNRRKLSYSLGVNHLADKTEEELRALRGYRSSNIKFNGGKPFPYDVQAEKETLPSQFDWRILGAVSQVKDQSVCGSCWSFGTIGAIEGAYFLKTGNLVRLSQQALIDCSWEFGNNGCDGGEDFRVYKFMMKVGGVPTEEAYGPYLGQDGYCHIRNMTLVAPITGFVNVTINDKDAFKLALFKHGPISVAIDASPKSFSFYSHGVYYEDKCKNDVDGLDHAVLAVGYGTLNGEDYWLVKNSWSNYWGNDGYILMSAKNNNCGVMTMPTYVTM